MTRTTWWTAGMLMIGGTSSTGCLIDLAGLDAGDTQADEAGDDTGSEGAGAVDECLQGSGQSGASASVDPGCEVVCAEGWAHDVAPLASAWTTELWLATDLDRSAALTQQLDGTLLAAIGGDPIRFVRVDAAGTLVDNVPQDISGSVIALERARDGSDAVHLLWHEGTGVRLRTSSTQGEWNVEFGPITTSAMAATQDGLVVGYAGDVYAVEGDQLELLVSIEGRIAALPSGGFVVASTGEIAWFDAQGTWMANRGLPVPLVVHDLLALDDTHVVVVGSDLEPSASAGVDALVLALSPNEDAWLQRYDRASSWCGALTHESFVGLARDGAGDLWLAGVESNAYPVASFDDLQPRVLRIDGQGGVLGDDRGAWHGAAEDVLVAGQTAYALLSEQGPEGELRVWLRSYPANTP